MLKYEYFDETDEGFIFLYYPEGDTESPGKVFIPKSGRGYVLEEAKCDRFRMYAFHAIKSIDPNEKYGMIAWY